MTAIRAIHYPLGHIDARSGNVGAIVHVGEPIHRSAVNSHPEFDLWIGLVSLTYFDRAFNGGIRGGKENERHSIPRWNSDQLPRRFAPLEMFGAAHQPIQSTNNSGLVVNGSPGIADNVDEKDVRDLELRIVLAHLLLDGRNPKNASAM